MTFLKVLGWIFVPFIMIFIQWKRLNVAVKVIGIVWSVITLTIGLTSHGDSTPTTTAPTAQQVADQKAQQAAQAAQEAAQKAQQDEKAKLVAQFKQAGANDTDANQYADDVMKLKGNDQAQKDQIQFYLNYAKAHKEQTEYMDWVNSKFSAWDGSVPALVDAAKQSMNDPSSFKHVETTYSSKGVKKGIDVYMTFRGTNAFGGVVTNQAHGYIDYATNTMKWEMVN